MATTTTTQQRPLPTSATGAYQAHHKLRMGQLVREGVGLAKKTKDETFLSAQKRHQHAIEQVAKLEAALDEHAAATRAHLAREECLIGTFAAIAAQSPLQETVAVIAAEHRVKAGALTAAVDARHRVLKDLVAQWRAGLRASHAAVSREQEGARKDYDHYVDKCAALDKRLASAASGSGSTATKRRRSASVPPTPVADKAGASSGDPAAPTPPRSPPPRPTTPPPAPSSPPAPVHNNARKAADDARFKRNDAKLAAARADYHRVTAAGIRIFDTASGEAWNELAPIVEAFVDCGLAVAGLAKHDDLGLRKAKAALAKAPSATALATRLAYARAGVPTATGAASAAAQKTATTTTPAAAATTASTAEKENVAGDANSEAAASSGGSKDAEATTKTTPAAPPKVVKAEEVPPKTSPKEAVAPETAKPPEATEKKSPNNSEGDKGEKEDGAGEEPEKTTAAATPPPNLPPRL